MLFRSCCGHNKASTIPLLTPRPAHSRQKAHIPFHASPIDMAPRAMGLTLMSAVGDKTRCRPRSETGSGAAWKGPSSGISIFGAVGGKRMSEPVVKRRETGQLPTSILRLVEVEVWLSMQPRECGYLH